MSDGLISFTSDIDVKPTSHLDTWLPGYRIIFSSVESISHQVTYSITSTSNIDVSVHLIPDHPIARVPRYLLLHRQHSLPGHLLDFPYKWWWRHSQPPTHWPKCCIIFQYSPRVHLPDGLSLNTRPWHRSTSYLITQWSDLITCLWHRSLLPTWYYTYIPDYLFLVSQQICFHIWIVFFLIAYSWHYDLPVCMSECLDIGSPFSDITAYLSTWLNT